LVVLGGTKAHKSLPIPEISIMYQWQLLAL
jgi:hypothetical protein